MAVIESGCLSMRGRLELQVKPFASSVSVIDLPGGALKFNKQAGDWLTQRSGACAP